jgi:hypothetical protein
MSEPKFDLANDLDERSFVGLLKALVRLHVLQDTTISTKDIQEAVFASSAMTPAAQQSLLTAAATIVCAASREGW